MQMDSFGKRLKAAREALSLAEGRKKKITQTELANRCGWENGQTRIANYENDTRNPSTRDIIILSKVTGCRAEWLRFGTGSMMSGESNVSIGPDIATSLPLISWVQAGPWAEAQDLFEVGDYEALIPVPGSRKYSKHAYALRVQGDSMSAPDGPSFPDGAIICVEPSQEPRHGSFVIVRMEDSKEATFKQLMFDGDRRFLKPLNSRYPMMEVDSEATFCGVVRQMVMDFD